MKVLILSITAGQGHHATAQALSAYLNEHCAACTVLDTYEYIAPLLKEALARGYLVTSAYTPGQLRTVYRLAELRTKPAKSYSLGNLTNTFFAYEIRDYINRFNPDVIICTHVFAASIVNVLKKKGLINAITVSIITDFTVHPFWEDVGDFDYYVTPSELLGYQLMRKGIDPSRMLAFGIPINEKFSTKLPKDEARKALGLDPNTTTVLIMSGSMGYGHIDKSIEKLSQLPLNFQLIVVCGNNTRQYKKISKFKTDRTIKVFGYIDNVDLMMDAADCIITKPGGITTSEAFAKELPMIMVNPIPGQEDRNMEFLSNNGLAMYATKTYPVDEALYVLLSNPENIEVMKRNIQRLGKKNSTKNLCEFLIESVNKHNTEK